MACELREDPWFWPVSWENIHGFAISLCYRSFFYEKVIELTDRPVCIHSVWKQSQNRCNYWSNLIGFLLFYGKLVQLICRSYLTCSSCVRVEFPVKECKINGLYRQLHIYEYICITCQQLNYKWFEVSWSNRKLYRKLYMYLLRTPWNITAFQTILLSTFSN